MKKCPNCNIVYEDNSQFCNSCGTQLVSVVPEPPVQPVKGTEESVKEWAFMTRFGGTGQRWTVVHANNGNLEVESWKQYIIKWGKTSETLHARDIYRIEYVKKWSPLSIMVLLCGLLALAAGEWFFGAVAAILGLLDIKTKHVEIIYPNGKIKIQDNGSMDKDIENFLLYVRRYNPNAVKVG